MRKRLANAVLAGVLLSGIISPSLFAAPREQGPEQKNPSPEQPPASAQPQAEPASPSQQTPPQEVPPAAKPPDTSNPPPSDTPGRPRLTRKKKAGKKPTTASQSGKVVVRNGGARDNSAQISPAINDEQARHQRENTNQLLATTDANLKKVAARQLTPAQQSTLDQIHAYVRQAKAASDSGDLPRAHTLAYKAHLLSDELARH
jgi:hypothetical protein